MIAPVRALPIYGIETRPARAISNPSFSMDCVNTVVTPTRPGGKSSPVSNNKVLSVPSVRS